jgi:hypothetical protein
MFRIGIVIVCLFFVACKNKKGNGKDEGFSYEGFSGQFQSVKPPYTLSDTGFLHNRDTATIQDPEFPGMIPDSIKTKLFGKTARVRYISMSSIKASNDRAYYIVKAISGSKKAALLIAFTKDHFGAVLPFLVPDADPSTSQVSSIDRSFSITKNISLKQANGNTAEGRDVYDFSADADRFSLILTNPINNGTAEVINPIDTFARKNKFSADYVKDKSNFVSVRDGRHPNQLTIFMHLDKKDEGCTGELKGDVLLTSPTAAIYRQGGDPCVLSFRFSNSSVTVKEDEGCGSHRGVNCVFDGTFNRKREAKAKTTTKRK